jgi:TolB-like protein/DNA-binding winged helix-turn-helix (wHTH) protein/Flp pilus assembly protein TadD
MQTRIRSFGAFELDPARYELRSNGKALRLERIPMELLLLLVTRNGQLVTRQEIIDAIWGTGVHLDSVQGVNTAIRKLRQILKDDPDNPKFIQTVVGKGYRFVAEVTEQGEAPVVEAVQAMPKGVPAEPPRAESPHRMRYRRIPWIIAMAGPAILIVVGLWMYLQRGKEPASIAILPFVNLTGSPGQEYFADGITEEAISLLGNVSPAQLRVLARTSIMQYKGTGKPISQIGRELGVDYILESSLREESGRVRITAQLIRVRDQMHVWAHNYDGELNSILGIQTSIASAIAEDLQIRLTPEARARLERPRQVDGEAYNAYLRGRYFWNLRDEANLEKASENFQQAIGLDPMFAAAYSGLADAQSLLAYGNYRAPTDAFSKARQAAEEALRLDPLAAEPHASSGYIKLYYDWDFPGAEKELRRALELNSNYATAHDWLGYVLTARGNFSDARKEFQEALRLDPLSIPVRTDSGFELHYSGDQQAAVNELRAALNLNPRFALAHFWLGRVYGAMGQCENALSELNAADAPLRDWQPMMAAKGHFLAKCGQAEEADAILARLADLSHTRYVTSYGVALVHAGLGHADEALNSLERAYDERSHWLVWLKLDPRFSTIHDQPRFQDLLNRVGLTTSGIANPVKTVDALDQRNPHG